MIRKRLNKYTILYIQKEDYRIDTILPNNKFWCTVFSLKFKKPLFHRTNVCENCDDMHDVKYMNEADASLCFNCREVVGGEIISDEQWEDTKLSLMGVI